MRWLPSWRVVLGTVVVIAAVGAGLFFAAYQSIAVPEPDDFSQAETTNVYYADGETLMGSYAEYDRTSVDFATLPSSRASARRLGVAASVRSCPVSSAIVPS